MDLWTWEREAWADGAAVVCGVDEAGAGPLAGPVYAAAVILPREVDLPELLIIPELILHKQMPIEPLQVQKLRNRSSDILQPRKMAWTTDA